ncbi:MAG: response regulator [Thermodesulfobacteriota bacterium]|nr:response regulator [Thermodesulfobacteriota bacterium]
MISDNDIKKARIMIVDDTPVNLYLLEAIVTTAGYQHVTTVSDPREVETLYQELEPHLVLLDISMPHMDGYQVMERLKTIEKDTYIPVMVLTAIQDNETRKKALACGAQDFLSKPFDNTEVLTRIRNMIKVRLLHTQIQNHNVILEEQVRQRTRELENTRLEIIRKLGQAAEYRDTETGAHIIRMSRMCAVLGELSGLSSQETELLLNASPMHDVGKIGVPDAIMLKPGRLTADEWRIMTEHTLIGDKLLEGHDHELMNTARQIALTHHEKWDGAGYPKGLKQDAIPLCGRIAALADVFDALTSKRPYKQPYPVEKALAIIHESRGTHFDPNLTDLFLDNIDRFIQIKEELSDDADVPGGEFEYSERDSHRSGRDKGEGK